MDKRSRVRRGGKCAIKQFAGVGRALGLAAGRTPVVREGKDGEEGRDIYGPGVEGLDSGG